MDAGLGQGVGLPLGLLRHTPEKLRHARHGAVSLNRVEAEVFEHAVPLVIGQEEHPDPRRGRRQSARLRQVRADCCWSTKC